MQDIKMRYYSELDIMLSPEPNSVLQMISRSSNATSYQIHKNHYCKFNKKCDCWKPFIVHNFVVHFVDATHIFFTFNTCHHVQNFFSNNIETYASKFESSVLQLACPVRYPKIPFSNITGDMGAQLSNYSGFSFRLAGEAKP